MSNQNIKLPIKVGVQQRYDEISHKSTVIYVCTDTGNIYLGDTPLGRESESPEDVLFSFKKDLTPSFGKVGQHCVTPEGVYEKTNETTWSLFSRWSISDEGELQIDGVTPIAGLDKLGFVRSSDKNGEVAVSPDGTMSVNGWDDISLSMNYIYRNE